MTYTLIIANKSYSSWSFRPWILMRHFGVDFTEITVPLGQPDTRAQILRFSPAGKCPVLRDGDFVVWDSLAIIEYVAEAFPELPIWPRGREARAQARSLSAEMHSGFMGVRSHLPMNFRRKVGERALTEEARADVARIEEAFAAARETFGAHGPFLFGGFSAADAMFAPVVSRLHSYAVPVTPQTRAYMDAVMALPAWRDWRDGALAEPWAIEKYDRL
ncbi:Glutathione S-transferase domain protein [Methylocella silvestris BL2]|uniref:Glutathione S-transferase domain protein n=1 Tax=Methylocella silvestris (strain DSM 15510 / CIP 108128 / LMG 27833 / NCIMB 13906 / BL2) TaxID=395965 RepID=B8EPD6_METSB|nr:glutathione S-transferase family protein [Methylocella silvestris]ACK49724.1 Glutathione S-transferase domain protein [Methylocella silvestris BL2]